MSVTATFLHSRPQREIASTIRNRLAGCRVAEIVSGFATPDGVDVLRAGSFSSKIRRLVLGAATFAAGLIRTNLVIKFVDSLRNASLVIEKRSSDAMKLKDRRAVQEAYAGSVATVNRLAKEVGCLRDVLSGFVGVDHVSAAVEGLQREYPRMKPNLFQGFPAALTVGIQQLRDAACELGDTLRQTTATGASLAARIS